MVDGNTLQFSNQVFEGEIPPVANATEIFHTIKDVECKVMCGEDPTRKVLFETSDMKTKKMTE